MLEKYEVGTTKNQVARFTFEEKGFYRKTKRRVLEKFSVEQIQDETESIRSAKIVLGSFLLFTLLTAYFINYSVLPYVLAVFSAISLIGMIGISHNFVHHKNNLFK